MASPAESSPHIRYAYSMEHFVYIPWGDNWYRVPDNKNISVILLQGTSQLLQLEWSDADIPRVTGVKPISTSSAELILAQKLDNESTARLNKVLEFLRAHD